MAHATSPCLREASVKSALQALVPGSWSMVCTARTLRKAQAHYSGRDLQISTTRHILASVGVQARVMIDLESSRVTVLGSSLLSGSSRAAKGFPQCVTLPGAAGECVCKERAKNVLVRKLDAALTCLDIKWRGGE
jgi:hypothetical protein